MALDSLLARLRSGEIGTPGTPPQCAGVPLKPASTLAGTPGTPGTPPETITKAETEEPAPITREHFAGLGVHLLADDLAFLRWHLPRATTARNTAVREYVRRWHEAMDGEPIDYRKDNAGRRAANTWLRTTSPHTTGRPLQ